MLTQSSQKEPRAFEQQEVGQTLLKGLHTQKGENQLLLGFRKTRVMEPLGLQTPETKDKKKTVDTN